MNPPTVLYVEDEENDVLFMQMAFERLGTPIDLQSVEDGSRAMAYLAGEGPYADRQRYPRPAVLLLDLNLPLHSGFEVLQWLRQEPAFAELPVVIFSSSGRPEDRARAHQLGASDYLLKPSSGLDFVNVAKHVQEQWLARS
jgi:CheY-like chemotaxis protein